MIYHRGERRVRRVLRLFQSLLRFSGASAFSVCSAVKFKDIAISLENSTVPDKVMKNLSFKKKALPKKYYTLYTRIKESFIHRLGPSEDAIAILFGEIDVHLPGKSGRLVLDLEVVEG